MYFLRTKMRLISRLGKVLVSLSFFLFSFQSIAQINWTARTSAADNTWNSVTYGSGLFVAASTDGGANRAMTSSDGITWTSRTSNSTENLTTLVRANNQYVAVSDTGKILSSK